MIARDHHDPDAGAVAMVNRLERFRSFRIQQGRHTDQGHSEGLVTADRLHCSYDNALNN